MSEHVDVTHLKSWAFGHRSLMWWGTMGMIAIEGTVFTLAIVAYVYLRGRTTEWPPSVMPPELLWGTLNTVLLLASAVPNQLAKSAAERLDADKAKFWMVVGLIIAVIFHIVRIFEFQSLNVWWDQNAYGSIVWLLLGFHTAHILTDFIDSTVLAAVLFVHGPDPCRLVDVAENALYWYFVVVSWLPIYVVIYLLPRVW